MNAERLLTVGAEEERRALIWSDIISAALCLRIHELGSNEDLARKLLENAHSRASSFKLKRQDEAYPYNFLFVSTQMQAGQRDEVVLSIDTAPLRNPLIIVKDVREIDGKVYHEERMLLTDDKDKLLMSFWQFSWKPGEGTIEQVRVNIEDGGLPIIVTGTSQQRVSREEAFQAFKTLN